MDDKFKALLVDFQDGKTTAELRELDNSDIPEQGDVLVAVRYSSLNYKDGLAVTGAAKVLLSHPMVPGIDLAGVVVESESPDFGPGDEVVVTGYNTGEKYWGGYSQVNRVRSKTLVRKPDGLSLKDTMAIGTAGLTAMLSVMALEDHGLSREVDEQIIVTGASGGVGSVAVALLAKLGYSVTASTGKPEARDYLEALGAREFIERESLASPSKRPLEAGRWSGAVDAVGGDTLAGLIRTMRPHTSIALSGNAGGIGLNTTVLPFILRGVNLLGIDSNFATMDARVTAWRRLSELLPKASLEQMTQEIPLRDVPKVCPDILKGRITGRLVVNIGD
ncbi:MAG: MDR family oxidoreductase [Myxococcota bacterium]|nr:MDR family oxidoreductase [Myxococcota bacterium]